MKFSRDLTIKWVTVVLSCIVALLFAEIGIRFSDLANGLGFFATHRNMLHDPIESPKPFRAFGPRFYPEKESEQSQILSTNGDVFPFSKPAGSFRIVFFGGSTTYTEPASIPYPRRVGQLLNAQSTDRKVEVINVAYNSYSTAHSLVILNLDVLSWQPDLLVISHNINDLTAAYFPDFTVDYANKYGTWYYGVQNWTNRYTPTNALFQHSQLYWLIRERIYPVESHQLSELQRRSYGMAPPARAAKTFGRNLRTFVATAAAHDVPVVLATQPIHEDEALFTIHMQHKTYNDIVVYPTHEEFLAHHAAYNETIRSTAKSMGAMLQDHAALMAGRREEFVDFVHHNDTGVERIAAAMAGFLHKSGVLENDSAAAENAQR